jgi:hypothetical protein
MAHIFFLLFPFKPAQAGLSHPPAHLHPVGPPLPPKPGRPSRGLGPFLFPISPTPRPYPSSPSSSFPFSHLLY